MDTENIKEAVTGAQSPDTFDVLSFVEATAYPTEKVVVFQNVKAADEYVKLVQARAAREVDSGEPDAIDDDRIEELGNLIRESSIVFELRGMPPGVINDILKPDALDEEVTDEETAARDNDLIARTIVRATNHAGVADPRVWKAEDVAQLRKFLKEGEFGKLLKGVSDVNFKAAIFDDATDAGFSGRSTDVA